MLIISFVIAAIAGFIIQTILQHRQSFTLIHEYFDDFFSAWDPSGTIQEVETAWMQNSVEASGKESLYDDAILARFVEANANTVSELSVVDENGIVTYSSNPDMVGVDLKNSDQLEDFLSLLEDEDYHADPMDSNPFVKDPSRRMAYVGTAFSDHQGMILKGMDEEVWKKRLKDMITDSIECTRIGVSGYLIGLDSEGFVCAASKTSGLQEGEHFDRTDLLPQEDEDEDEIKDTFTELYGENSYVSAVRRPDFYLVGVYPVAEPDHLRNVQNNLIVVLYFVVFVTLFIVSTILIRNHVLKQVEGIHTSLQKIREGDLSERVNVGGSVEFTELSSGINEMVENLTDRLEQEKRQLAEKLENARRIQDSAVPHVFPEHTAFGLFACMETAEAVGGDFYDFYLPGHDILAFVMADVSGFGMPAALYMMRAKTLMKTYAEQGLPVEQVAEETNRRLCEDEMTDMFVTAWIGFLDLRSGKFGYVNAGHPAPVLISDDAAFLKEEADPALGRDREAHFRRQEGMLQNGDSIFLYTSGLPGALNQSGEAYGKERLLAAIKGIPKDAPDDASNAFCEKGCAAVQDDVKQYVSGAKRRDDITMMWVRYRKQ